jgi:hypothetical protein
MVPLLRPPLSAQAVSIPGFGRIEDQPRSIDQGELANRLIEVFTNRAADQPTGRPAATA